MKNTKLTKILATAATLALIVLSIFVIAGAEGEELSVKINARNVSYGETVKILFAVDDTNAGDNEVELLYYLEDPIENPAAQGYLASAYDKGYTDKNGTDDTADDVTYPAFFTAGFPAKNIGDAVYARAHIVGTDIYSEVERYSVVEYLLERLYVDRADGDKAELYKYLLGYGAYAQKVILNGNDTDADDVEKFVDELVLVGIPGGTLDGKYAQGTYFVGDTITPYIEGAAGLNVTVFDLTTGEGTTTLVANGASVTVEGFTMITASDVAPEEPEAAYKPDLSDTAGKETFEGDLGSVIGFSTYVPNGTIGVVDGAPYGESSKIYSMNVTTSGATNEANFKALNIPTGATHVFVESDIMIDADGAYNIEIQMRGSGDSGYPKFYFAVTSEGTVELRDTNYNKIAEIAEVGEWFRFTYTYEKQDDGTYASKVYVNEQEVEGSSAIVGTCAVSVLNRVRFMSHSAFVGSVNFDNTKVSIYIPPYVPDFSDTEGRETYEDGNAVDSFRFDNNPASGSGAITDGAPYGVASKVYGFTYNAGHEVNFRSNGVFVGTDKAVFETDMLIASTADSIIKLEFRGSGNGLTVLITTDANGVVTVKDSAGNAIATITTGEEWFRFKAECSGSTVTFYINDVQLGALPISIEGKTVNRLRFYADKGAGTIYFDNTKAIFVQ